MAKLINCSIEYFMQEAVSKRIVAFGAGRKCMSFIKEYSLENKIEFIVDNDVDKQGKEIIINEVPIKIANISKMIEYKENYIILITSSFSVAQIMEQLNLNHELEEVECYCAALMLDNCPSEKIDYTIGEPLIPKVIHYCWFGNKPIPDGLLKCMESWKRFCPDYEIVRWDESNYDVHKNKYMSQAYESRRWGFVPDYARLDIVGTYGGIYLDTDVELIKSLDDLLADNSFLGFLNYDRVALGLGFGSVAGNEFILKLRDDYNDKRMIKENGIIDMRPCTEHQVDVLKKYGFVMNNKQQRINGNVLYPMEVFNPTGVIGVADSYTCNTHSIHRGTLSWESEVNMHNYHEGKAILKNILSEL